MQKGRNLEFKCKACQQDVRFSIFELDTTSSINCPQCSKKYALKDETFKRQLRKFEALCRQILDSEEILANTAIGIDIGDQRVKIPYKLLLTRLSSSLDLLIGNEPFSINFRIEPLKDIPISTP
jgi:DNA-directed RNA polymerase subunit RPC12/RpoP